MIVKNEAPVIRRCLNSLQHLIDYWVIVDTGSTDGTQEIIQKYLQNIPGELHERPWLDFEHNRNEAMALAKGKGDYLLVIDADDQLVFSDSFSLPALKADLYSVLQREGVDVTFREHHIYLLIRNDGCFEWKGVLHEYLSSSMPRKNAMLEGVYCLYGGDGNRSKDPSKIQKDIALLQEAIRRSPNDSRNVFYLARTYWSIGEHSSALDWFTRRVQMGGDPIEIYHSLLYIALSQKMLNKSEKTFLDSFSVAYAFRPSRLEPVYEMARYYNQSNRFLEAYALLKLVEKVPLPQDNLFVETWVWEWGISLQMFVAVFSMRFKKQALYVAQKLLQNPKTPQKILDEYRLKELVQCLEEELCNSYTN